MGINVFNSFGVYNKSVKILLRLLRHNFVIGRLMNKRKSGIFLDLRKPMSIFVLLANFLSWEGPMSKIGLIKDCNVTSIRGCGFSFNTYLIIQI